MTSDISPPIEIPVSPGELIDRISILEIKAARIREPEKLENVGYALAQLEATRCAALTESAELDCLEAELKAVNEALWEVEDEIRACEAAGDFGPRFVELARAVYQRNDRRAVVKKAIDRLFGSRLTEEKSYRAY